MKKLGAIVEQLISVTVPSKICSSFPAQHSSFHNQSWDLNNVYMKNSLLSAVTVVSKMIRTLSMNFMAASHYVLISISMLVRGPEIEFRLHPPITHYTLRSKVESITRYPAYTFPSCSCIQAPAVTIKQNTLLSHQQPAGKQELQRLSD